MSKLRNIFQIIPVKYQVALDDGTVVAETLEGGFEFYVKDGNFFGTNEGIVNILFIVPIRGD
jgi:hypothetical protein